MHLTLGNNAKNHIMEMKMKSVWKMIFALGFLASVAQAGDLVNTAGANGVAYGFLLSGKGEVKRFAPAT